MSFTYCVSDRYIKCITSIRVSDIFSETVDEFCPFILLYSLLKLSYLIEEVRLQLCASSVGTLQLLVGKRNK